jgi:Zn-dependent protease
MAQIYDSKLLLALSYSGFFLNLFNLIPVSPFDGGRITGVISPRVWLIGAPILGGLFFMNPNPLLLLMAFLAAPQVLKAIRGIRGQEEEAYYTTPLDTRIRYGALYLALAGFLAIMTQAVHEQLQGPTGL